MPSKRYGIRLIAGGAPATPHTIAGLPGLYRPDVPTPVGEPGDAIEDLEVAKAEVAKRSDALEVVEIPAGKVEAAVETAETDVATARQLLKEAARDGRAEDDTSRYEDEKQAVRGSKQTQEGGR